MKLKYSRTKKLLHYHGEKIKVGDLYEGEQFVMSLGEFKDLDKNPKAYITKYRRKGNDVEYWWISGKRWIGFVPKYATSYKNQEVWVWDK